jgi:hypothetical protein
VPIDATAVAAASGSRIPTYVQAALKEGTKYSFRHIPTFSSLSQSEGLQGSV